MRFLASFGAAASGALLASCLVLIAPRSATASDPYLSVSCTGCAACTVSGVACTYLASGCNACGCTQMTDTPPTFECLEQ